MDMTWLMLSMVYSTVGLGMFMYGKRAVRFVPLVAGLLLMIIPYFLGNVWVMTGVCLVLMGSPFMLSGLEL